MSKPNEDRDVYYIPPNFLTSGRLFGGMIRARNAIEACVLVLLTGVPIIKLPFSLTTRIIILCLVSLPLGIFGVIGFEGDSLSEFAVNWVRWLIHRRTLYRSDTPVPEAPEKPMKAVSGMSAPKPPEQLGIKIKEKPKKRKKRKPVKKPHKASKHKSSVAKKKQPLHAEDFIPVRDIRNGIIETTDGRYLRVIEVEPINFLLRNISEQKNIVASFASWMKISPVKVQIKVLTKKADIGKHLNTIEREMEAEDNPKCRDLQLDYYHLIQTIGSREAITRRFLVIFEYEAVTNRKPEYPIMSIIVADKILFADINADQMYGVANELNLDSVTGWHSVFLADDSMIYMYRQCLWLSMNLTYEDLLAMLKECISEYKRGKGRLTTGDHPTNPVA